MNALYRRKAPTKRQEALLNRLVRVTARLQDLTLSSDDCAVGDREFLLLSSEEKTESKALVIAAGFGFCVPESLFCSLLRTGETTLLKQSLDNWNDLSFQQRALMKETLFLLSLVFSLLEPIKLDRQGRGNIAVKEAAIARMQLGL